MNMTWDEIMELGLSMVPDAPEAGRQKYTLLNSAIQFVWNRLDVPELHVADATVPTVANQDYIEHDCGSYAIRFIVDQSTGRKLDPEEDGMRGRAKYFKTGDDKPNVGELHRYCRDGNRIWLRDTPDSVRTLTIGFRMQAPTVSQANLTEHPITPEQYDQAYAFAMAARYFQMFPPMEAPDLPPNRNAYRHYEEAALRELAEQESPKGLENRDQHHHFRTYGYHFGVMGR